MKLLLGVISLFLLSGTLCTQAQVVSLRYVENPDPVTDAPIPFSESVISGVMDGMFDSGMIATSDTIFRGEIPSAHTVKISLGDAREGMVDFVLALYAVYKPSVFRVGYFFPASFNYYLYDVKTEILLQDGVFQGIKDQEDLEKERIRLSKELGHMIADAAGKIIARGKGE